MNPSQVGEHVIVMEHRQIFNASVVALGQSSTLLKFEAAPGSVPYSLDKDGRAWIGNTIIFKPSTPCF